jgi:hypothetical protein
MDWAGWSKITALVVAALVMITGGRAWKAASLNGEVYGLKAKFVNVNGIWTRYYELIQGEPSV